ncbi:AMP-binding protein [Nocardia sp. IBHARD005]|uniref:AMP-binding protein n=1 Tax=Nocardia sp. IBHARD005 TaxID=3457765 RepID=UPI00405927B0
MPSSRGPDDSANAIAALADRAAAPDRRDRPAYYLDGRHCTHGELHSLAARMAGVLAGRGVRAGTRVLLCAHDSIGWIATFLAIGRLGAVAILVNPGLAEPELQALVASVRPLLTVGRGAGGLAIGLDELEHDAATAPEAPAARVDSTTPLYVQFTSGTTGAPKGAVHCHGDLAHHFEAVGRRMLRIEPDDVTFSVSKLFFAYGFGNSLIYPLYSGSAAVLLAAKPGPAQVAEAADRYGVTVLHAVPSALAHLVAEADAAAFQRVRVVVSAGERLSTALGERGRALFGVPVLDELGSTEVGGAWCANTLSDNMPGTVGRPLHGYRIEVRDRDGHPVPDDTEGQLHVSGPTLLTEYLDRPEATAAALKAGWLATRDTGIRRADGRFVHTGRVDDIEIVGGINIAPAEIEDLLTGHPGVREAAVAAFPDPRGATRLRAFVVTATQDRTALADELTALVRSRLAPFKVPRTITFVDALPRTPTGKLRRHVVRTGDW